MLLHIGALASMPAIGAATEVGGSRGYGASCRGGRGSDRLVVVQRQHAAAAAAATVHQKRSVVVSSS